VGFLAGWNHPGDWPPLAAAIGAALLASYATFLPSFFFILIAAPYVERLRALPWLTGGLATVTAAVVGVILNLGVTFAAAVLWSPTGLDLFAAVLATAAAIALVRGIAVPWVVLGGGVVGLATHLASSI
jgi:chromate transporter